MNRLMAVLLFALFSLSLISCSGGGGAGSADIPPGVNPGQVSLLKLMPDRNVAQTGAYAYFHARLIDNNGIPVSGKPVNFTSMTAGSTLTAATATTDRDGIAKVGVRMTFSGYATVIAEAEGLRDKRSLLFTNSNSIRGYSLNPIIVILDADRNMNGIYNEADDFKVCQGANTSSLRIKVSTYVMGLKGSDMKVGISSDYPTLVNFPNTPAFDPATSTYYVTTNSQGEATVDVTVNCQLQTGELLFNIQAITDLYYVKDFDAYFSGVGAMSIFMQPVSITGVTLSAEPASVITGGTSNIRAVLTTNSGSAPDNTAVQFYTTCGTVNPTSPTTTNGAAETVFSAPGYIPQGGICTVVAKAGSKTASIDIIITGPPAALEVQPSTLTIDGTRGGTATFTVIGGSPSYRIFSGNTAFVPNPSVLSKSGDTFTVTVPANTTAQAVTFTIRDSQGQSVAATLDITSSALPLSISPSAATMLSSESAVFVVTGGIAPYAITSNRPLVASASPSIVTTNGGIITVSTGIVTANETVVVTARDAAGTVAITTITVNPPVVRALSVSPGAATLRSGEQGIFTVTGGYGPYTVTSSRPSIASVPLNVSGNTFTVTAGTVSIAAGEVATMTVRDSTGALATATVTVMPSAIVVVPNPITVAIGETALVSISGGTAPYTITASRAGVANISPTTVAVSGGTFTVTGLTATGANPLTLNIRDALGNQQQTTVTVTAGVANPLAVNPQAAAIGAGETATFTVTGGVAPYNVVSSRPTIAFNTTSGSGTWTVPSNGGTFTVTGGIVNAATAVSFTITDAAGTILTQPTVTVNPGGGVTFSVSPSTVTLAGTAGTDDRVTFTIYGGTGPFTVLTSNGPIIPAPTVSGRTFTINPNPVGANTNVTLTVVDLSNGATVLATVTVTPLITNFSVNPSAVSMTASTATTFYIIGGTGPFTVISGNSTQVAVEGAGVVNLGAGVRSFRVDAVAATPVAGVIITVVDTVGGARAISTVIVN